MNKIVCFILFIWNWCRYEIVIFKNFVIIIFFSLMKLIYSLVICYLKLRVAASEGGANVFEVSYFKSE